MIYLAFRLPLQAYRLAARSPIVTSQSTDRVRRPSTVLKNMDEKIMNSPVLSPTNDVTSFRRSPNQVMKLDRMAAAHPTRLSFLRQLLRRAKTEGWRFDRPLWDINDKGIGRAIYRARCPERTYSLVAFAHDLPDGMRSDRVIATAWDATFALFDGDPGKEDIDRLEANVPLQEAGRITQRELSLSRANRSVRLFAHVVERL